MLLVSTLLQLQWILTVLARPTEPSPPEEEQKTTTTTTPNPHHAVLAKRANQCNQFREVFQASYCAHFGMIATQCRSTKGQPYYRTYYDLCPPGQFCLERFLDNPEQAICISIPRAVHWATRVGDSCQGVDSRQNIGKEVRMLVDVFDKGKAYVPQHVSLYHDYSLIQEVGPADIQGGTFVSRPFQLLGDVLTCVRAAAAGRDVFAYIRNS